MYKKLSKSSNTQWIILIKTDQGYRQLKLKNLMGPVYSIQTIYIYIHGYMTFSTSICATITLCAQGILIEISILNIKITPAANRFDLKSIMAEDIDNRSKVYKNIFFALCYYPNYNHLVYLLTSIWHLLFFRVTYQWKH